MNYNGYCLHSGFLGREGQEKLLLRIRDLLQDAPLYTPQMPRTGKPMSVRMSNCGTLGWVSDKQGYRYQEYHPENRIPWPAIPQILLDIWAGLAGYSAPPEACLINYYDAKARLGLHVDKDEIDMKAPIVSISLGDTALFRMGGTGRRDPTRSVRIISGDVMIMAGPARRCYHGVDRIYPGTSSLLAEGGRFNLTLRRVSTP